MLSCQGLQSPTEPKGVARHPHPLRYWLHQMLATLRNRAKNRFYNESVLRINRANSPPGEDTLCQGGTTPPTSSPSLPSTRSPPLSAEGLGTTPQLPYRQSMASPLQEGWGSKVQQLEKTPAPGGVDCSTGTPGFPPSSPHVSPGKWVLRVSHTGPLHR